MLLSIFDQIYLISSFLLFGLSVFYPGSEFITVHLPYYFLPVAHIGMIGSIFSTFALSIERYIAVVHPFVKYRHWWKPGYFILPVIAYSLLYNIPKFFELSIELKDCSEYSQKNSTEGNF